MTKFFAKFLQSNLKNPPSHINNSFELRNKLSCIKIPDDYEIISLDVVSLFTNVHEDLIYEAIGKRWPQLFNKINLTSYEFIYNHNNNFFQFNNRYCRQIFGSAMGNPISPILVDIVMQDLENDALHKLEFQVPFYFRYVNDILLCVPKQQIAYTQKIFNSYSNYLQITIEKSTNNRISFLDLLIIKNNDNTISLDWYRKPTFSGRFLNYYSHHPIATNIGVICKLVDRSMKLADGKFHQKNIKLIKQFLINN